MSSSLQLHIVKLNCVERVDQFVDLAVKKVWADEFTIYFNPSTVKDKTIEEVYQLLFKEIKAPSDINFNSG